MFSLFSIRRRKRIILIILSYIFTTSLLVRSIQKLDEYEIFKNYYEITEYENTRLKVLAESNNFWDFVFSSLLNLQEHVPENMKQDVKETIILGSEQNSSLANRIKELAVFDGYDQWRNGEYIFKLQKRAQPILSYEFTRRQIESEVLEFWYYLSSQLTKLRDKAPEDMKMNLTKILESGVKKKRTLFAVAQKIKYVDGYNSWRESEAKNLSDLVQESINISQNTKDCEHSKKLSCTIGMPCGLGCQLHHVAKCLTVAYGTNRTLILDSFNWAYDKKGFYDMFLPISNSCTSTYNQPHDTWPGNSESQIISFPRENAIVPRSPFHPVVIPSDIVKRLTVLHGDPRVWWVGQLLKYLMRPQQKYWKIIEENKSKINFTGPIVGVHIRRTDKVKFEASFHELKEYMIQVEEYFEQLETSQHVDKRKIYIATDDPAVFSEVRKEYAEYEVLGDVETATAAGVNLRYSDRSFHGLLNDIYYLSHSNYLVCTLSSTLCRIVYAIRQQYEFDATSSIRSLDDIYWYSDQPCNEVVVVKSHTAFNWQEIDLEVGDVVGIEGNHWNGYSKGTNMRTSKRGLFPSFKVVKKFESLDYPIYYNVTSDR